VAKAKVKVKIIDPVEGALGEVEVGVQGEDVVEEAVAAVVMEIKRTPETPGPRKTIKITTIPATTNCRRVLQVELLMALLLLLVLLVLALLAIPMEIKRRRKGVVHEKIKDVQTHRGTDKMETSPTTTATATTTAATTATTTTTALEAWISSVATFTLACIHQLNHLTEVSSKTIPI
jgi:hypothetical protein